MHKIYEVRVSFFPTPTRIEYTWAWYFGLECISMGAFNQAKSLIIAYREAVVWAMNYGPQELRDSLYSQRPSFGA